MSSPEKDELPPLLVFFAGKPPEKGSRERRHVSRALPPGWKEHGSADDPGSSWLFQGVQEGATSFEAKRSSSRPRTTSSVRNWATATCKNRIRAQPGFQRGLSGKDSDPWKIIQMEATPGILGRTPNFPEEKKKNKRGINP